MDGMGKTGNEESLPVLLKAFGVYALCFILNSHNYLFGVAYKRVQHIKEASCKLQDASFYLNCLINQQSVASAATVAALALSLAFATE